MSMNARKLPRVVLAALLALLLAPIALAGSSGTLAILIGIAMPSGLGAISQIKGPTDQRLALLASSPAQAASTVAGNGLSITASPAVAGTTNAGAAAGGTITLMAGAAAQKTSGNANGGDIDLVPGAGVGTGTLGLVKIPAGGSTTKIMPSGVIYVNVTPASTAGTSEETLMSYSLPANALNANGRALRITAVCSTAANANNKGLKILFGAASVADNGIKAVNNGSIILSGIVIRTGASTQLAFGGSDSRGTGLDIHDNTLTTSAAETLSNAVTIALRGTTPTSAGDITAYALIIEMLN